jgi:hypothetical protein
VDLDVPRFQIGNVEEAIKDRGDAITPLGDGLEEFLAFF